MLEDVDCLFYENEGIDITTDGRYANTLCFEVGYEYILTRCYVMSVPVVSLEREMRYELLMTINI